MEYRHYKWVSPSISTFSSSKHTEMRHKLTLHDRDMLLKRMWGKRFRTTPSYCLREEKNGLPIQTSWSTLHTTESLHTTANRTSLGIPRTGATICHVSRRFTYPVRSLSRKRRLTLHKDWRHHQDSVSVPTLFPISIQWIVNPLWMPSLNAWGITEALYLQEIRLKERMFCGLFSEWRFEAITYSFPQVREKGVKALHCELMESLCGKKDVVTIPDFFSVRHDFLDGLDHLTSG